MRAEFRPLAASAGGQKICAMAVCHGGDSPASVKPSRRSGRSAIPSWTCCANGPTSSRSPTRHAEPNGIPHYWKTEYLAELSDDLLSTMQDVAAKSDLPEGKIGVLQLGGALNEHDEHDGAVGNRDARSTEDAPERRAAVADEERLHTPRCET